MLSLYFAAEKKEKKNTFVEIAVVTFQELQKKGTNLLPYRSHFFPLSYPVFVLHSVTVISPEGGLSSSSLLP